MNWGRKRHMETKRKDGHKPKKEKEDIKVVREKDKQRI